MRPRSIRYLSLAFAAVCTVILWTATMALSTRAYSVYNFAMKPVSPLSSLTIVPPISFAILLTILIIRRAIRGITASDTGVGMIVACSPLIFLLLPVTKAFALEGVLFALCTGATLILCLIGNVRRDDRNRVVAAAGPPRATRSDQQSSLATDRPRGKQVLANLRRVILLRPRFAGVQPVAGKRCHPSRRVCLLIVVLMSLIMTHYLYNYQVQQYETLRIGRQDVDTHYLRIRETALFRGLIEHSPDYPRFYDHFNPGLLLFVPLHWLWPDVTMLFMVQAVSLSLTGLAVFIYADSVLKRPAPALLCAAATLLHPSVSQMAYNFSYGFQVNCVVLPWLIICVYLWDRRKYLLFSMLMALSCMMKETHATFFVAMGIAEWVRSRFAHRSMRAPAILTAAAAAYLILTIGVILPQYAKSSVHYTISLFHTYGQSAGDVVAYFITHPLDIIGHVFSLRVVRYLAMILTPVLFLPLLAPERLSYGLLSLAGTLFMTYDDMLKICFWHQVDFLAAACVALPWGIRRCCTLLSSTAIRVDSTIPALASVWAAWVMSYHYGLLPTSKDTLPLPMLGPLSSEQRLGANEIHRLARSLPGTTRILSSDRASTAFLDFDRVTTVSQYSDNVGTAFDLVVVDFTDTGWTHRLSRLKQVTTRYLISGDFHVMRYDYIVIAISKRLISQDERFVDLIKRHRSQGAVQHALDGIDNDGEVDRTMDSSADRRRHQTK